MLMLQLVAVLLPVCLKLNKRFQPEALEKLDNAYHLYIGAAMSLLPALILLPCHLWYICKYWKTLLARHSDRGFKDEIVKVVTKNKQNNQKEEVILSKMVTQTQLNELYTGPEFDQGLVLAQIQLTMLISTVACAFAPIVLPVTLVLLTFIYWYSKYMLLKFNSKGLSDSN